MNVNELMSREPRAVAIGERLDAAARILWDGDFGFVPVVDADGVLVGVLTDRDLCMATYTQNRVLAEIPVADVMARAVRSCRADDTIATAMTTMQQAQVHRLPVVDARNMLVGVVATNDLVRAAQARPAAVGVGNVMQCLATIGAPRHVESAPPQRAGKAATASAASTGAASGKAGSRAASSRPTTKAKAKAKPKGRKA